MARPKINKNRKQISIWSDTADYITELREQLGLSQVEIIHLAVAEYKRQVDAGEDYEHAS